MIVLTVPKLNIFWGEILIILFNSRVTMPSFIFPEIKMFISGISCRDNSRNIYLDSKTQIQ